MIIQLKNFLSPFVSDLTVLLIAGCLVGPLFFADTKKMYISVHALLRNFLQVLFSLLLINMICFSIFGSKLIDKGPIGYALSALFLSFLSNIKSKEGKA